LFRFGTLHSLTRAFDVQFELRKQLQSAEEIIQLAKYVVDNASGEDLQMVDGLMDLGYEINQYREIYK
jgi:hypothetical protein